MPLSASENIVAYKLFYLFIAFLQYIYIYIYISLKQVPSIDGSRTLKLNSTMSIAEIRATIYASIFFNFPLYL
jgi:hypothetical protein